MYVSIDDIMKSLEGGVKFTEHETAFPPQMTKQILDLAYKNQWIVLGGDVLTPELKYTYDNWYYDPVKNISLLENVKRSIQMSEQYISEYTKRNGENWLFVFAISNGYRNGTI